MTEQPDEHIVQRLKAWAADYHAPPDTPRDVMWQAIARHRAARRQPQPVHWLRWSVGIAAALAIGIALGRLSPATSVKPATKPLAATLTDTPTSNVAYEVATRDHMQRVETFLNVFHTEAEASRLDGSVGGPARILAVQNRLLLTSPAAGDPVVRQLLDDIELVLMQIQQYNVTGSREDLDFINDGIEQRGVLLKLRTASTQGAT